MYAEFVDNFSKKASDGSKTFVRGETVLPSGMGGLEWVGLQL